MMGVFSAISLIPLSSCADFHDLFSKNQNAEGIQLLLNFRPKVEYSEISGFIRFELQITSGCVPGCIQKFPD
jgi:hypothetical protein